MSDDVEGEEMQAEQGATIPDRLRQLRACLRCKLVKTSESFRSDACENCQEFRDLDIAKYTTPIFKGMIAMMDPVESWVARYQMSQLAVKRGMVPGLYAIQVTGNLDELADQGQLDDEAEEEEEEEALVDDGDDIE